MTNGRELNYREFSNQPHIKHLDEANKKYQYNLYSMQILAARKAAAANNQNRMNAGQNNQPK